MKFKPVHFREFDRPKKSGDYFLIAGNYWLIDDRMNVFLDADGNPYCYESEAEAREKLESLNSPATSVMYLHEAWLGAWHKPSRNKP